MMYVAFGALYVAMALLSIRTLKRQNPDVPVTLVTNYELDIDRLRESGYAIDTLLLTSKPTASNRDVKTSIGELTSYEKTIFLDCDTLVLGSLERLFWFLDYFDVAIRLNPTRQTRPDKGDISFQGQDVALSELPHWNSGVIAFKSSPRTETFFSTWNSLFHGASSEFDQVSLVGAIFNTEVRLLSLTTEWNFMPISSRDAKIPSGVRIVHYTNRISFSLARILFRVAEDAGIHKETIRTELIERRRARLHKAGVIGGVILRIRWALRFFQGYRFLEEISSLRGKQGVAGDSNYEVI